MNMFSMVRFPVIAAVMVLSCGVAHAVTASYNPATDFSLAGNPNGSWSYGYSQTLGGPLVLHTTSGSGGGLDYWNTPIWIGLPWIARNSTAAPITWSGTAQFAPGALSLHPGAFGEIETLRFTVPVDGQYLVAGSFFGQDFVGPTSTDVHVLLNGTSIFNDMVSDFGISHAFNPTLALTAGTHLDFAVGYGNVTPNVYDSNYYDSTGLTVLITQVPEPGTLALVGGATGLLCRFRRRENSAG